MSSIYFI